LAGISSVNDENENTAEMPDDTAMPPSDAAPPDVVADAAPGGPASHAPDDADAAEAEAVESSSSSGSHSIATNGQASDEPIKMDWYILKVQSNREDSIRESLLRRVQMEGLDKYFAEVIVPIETVTEFKGGKKKVVKRKLYPGYLVVRMEINDDTWYLVRETPGIGDFTGSIGRPTPMAAADIAKILSKTEDKPDETPRLNIRVKKGDRVKINEGTFENFEGEVDSINEASGRVIVIINIFGRPTPVELEHWQIEPL
jgi:transcription termination/antitermination protein NusG